MATHSKEDNMDDNKDVVNPPEDAEMHDKLSELNMEIRSKAEKQCRKMCMGGWVEFTWSPKLQKS